MTLFLPSATGGGNFHIRFSYSSNLKDASHEYRTLGKFSWPTLYMQIPSDLSSSLHTCFLAGAKVLLSDFTIALRAFLSLYFSMERCNVAHKLYMLSFVYIYKC